MTRTPANRRQQPGPRDNTIRCSLEPFSREVAMKPRPDPTNLDHVAYTVVGLGIVGWLFALLIR